MRASVSSRPTHTRTTSRAHLLVRLAIVLLLALGLAPALTAQPASAAISALSINSHSCPYGTDVASLSYNDLAAACQGSPALDYTINGPNYAQQVSAGLYTASDLEPGTYYVTQGDYSATYGPPAAYCGVDDELGGDVTVGTPTSVVAGSQSPIELTVDGYTAFCDVYNAELTPPPTTSTDAEVYISKWICPEGYTSTGYNDLVQDCSTEHEGVTFTIEDFAGDAQSDDTGGQPARAAFTGWKTGGATITETVPQGYGEAVVYCYAQDEFGTVFPGYDLTNYPAIGGRISIDIPTDPNGGLVSFFCDWYNVPSTGYTDDAEVYISKWECPAGYSSDDYDDLSSECSRELEGIDFTITHEGGDSASDDTGGQPARAAFTPWYNGASTITESIPDGYGIPVVYCRATDDFNDPLPGYELTSYPVTDGSIDIVIPDAAPNTIVSFFCDWYNIPTTPTYGGIYVHKYGCPQGYGTDSSFEELASGCYTIVRGAEFAVSGPEGYSDSQTLYDIDLGWENLAPGDYTVDETPPSGYRDSKVWCAYGSYEGGPSYEYEEVDVTDGGIALSFGGGAYADCVWYNIPPPASTGGQTTPTTNPSGPATLVIAKWTCEEDYDEYAPKADPTEDCDETTDGVSFTLRGGRDSSLTRVTGEDDDPGTATFANLPAGSYLLQEDYPEGVTSAFVWECDSSVRGWVYAFAPFATIGEDGTTKINVVPGETLTCSWYDVPSPEGDEPGSEANVRVAVLDCPGDLVNENSCEPAAAGVAVDLSSDDDDASLETDDEGVAAGEVPPGGYDLEVEGGICFADSDAFDGDGLLTVGDDPVEVTVFRCEG